MKKILHYLNPMLHLGDRRYPVLFPLLTVLGFTLFLEFLVNIILRDPSVLGAYAVFPYTVLIIYFAFRAGIRGGLIAAVITVAFYFYIIYSRNYSGEQLRNVINTTVLLGMVYILLGWLIGWLKERIDKLVELEVGEKKRLQTILQQLPIGVVVADREGKIEHMNKQIYETFKGYTNPHSLIGKDTLVNVTHRGRPVSPSQWPIAKTLATGKIVSNKEYVIEQDDGKKVYLDVSASPIHNREGDMVAAASVFTDITPQKLMEQRKDDFINMASHELKTPLTSMKLYLDVLNMSLAKRGDEKERVLMTRIKDQTDRLQKLIYDLLDVSRIQTGKLTFSKEKVNLDEIIEEIVEILQQTTEKQKITLHRTNKRPVIVIADKFRLYQVLTNLITNAIKYSGDGKEIVIAIKKMKEVVVVSIQDFGIGISKDQQKKIFDRLYQAGDDRESTFPGFGMGLYIAKEIINRHKGKIWVESEKGKGSTFFFSLPLQK